MYVLPLASIDIRKFFPSDECNLVTALRTDDVQKRISNAIKHKAVPGVHSVPRDNKGGVHTLQLRYAVGLTASTPAPSEASAQTKVNVKLDIPVQARLFASIWFVILGVMSAVLLASGFWGNIASEPEFWMVIPVPFLVFLLMYAIMRASFHVECRIAKQYLIDLLEVERTEDRKS